MKNTVLRFGLIAAGVLVVMMLISLLSMRNQSMDFGAAEIFGYLTMLAALSMVFFGIRNWKNQQVDPLTFKQGFLVGLYITLIASVIYVISWMVLSNWLAPDFADLYFDKFIEELRASDQPIAEIEAQVEKYEANKEMYKKPLVQIGMTFLEIFPIGLMVTLISALILRQKK
ncbi:MAG: DUF4199 domain-containing protein [Saprospiraceae bacterium]